MNRQSFRKNLRFLIGVTILFLLVSSPIVAQQGATFSGRVVDELERPVANSPVAIQPYSVMGGGMRQEGFSPFQQAWTDLEGRFSITNIVPESVTLIVGDREEETEILSVQIGELLFYPMSHPHFGKMRFSLKAGAKIENVVITLKTDMKPHIRARLVFADGTPVANTGIFVNLRRRDLDGSGRGNSTGPADTDADGYFVEELDDENDLAFYILGVEYDGLVAKSVPFILYEGQLQVHLLLTLNGNLSPSPEQMPGPVEMGGALTKFLNPPAVWAVNPENGHAYKKIECRGITDAIAQATAERAYLVAINDASEATWIQEIFGRGNFWIGLNDIDEEGRWAWDSGEPVTYTNWDQHSAEGDNTEMKDYVVVEFSGQWRAIEAGNPRARHITEAILEKSVISVKIPSETH